MVYIVRKTQQQQQQQQQQQTTTASPLGLSEIHEKTQRCRKHVYDGLENAYYL